MINSKPLEVEPVCKSCNNKRGPAEGNDAPYSNDLDFVAGRNYSALGRDRPLTWNERKSRQRKGRDFEASGGGELVDEHWVTYEPDWGVHKLYQETTLQQCGRIYTATSFLRGLYDWYGVEPV